MADEKTGVMLSAKEKLFRGKHMEELKKLDTREFAKFLKSRQRRAVLRSFNMIDKFIKSCQEKVANGKAIRTHSRELVIVPAMVGMTIGIHTGKEFFPVKIVEEMLGHRLGEFALTRKFIKHGAAGVGATKSSAALSVK